MIVSTFVVEDEPLARKTLRDFIGETSWLELVGEAADGLTAVRAIDELKPDLIFLDVDLPEINGLQVLERIRAQTEVVFTTAHDKYAPSAFEFDALDYLIKPFGRERFQNALKRVRRRLSALKLELPNDVSTLQRARHALQPDNLTRHRLFVRDREMLLPIATRDITRLEACDDYTAVHLARQKYLIHLSLTEVTARLDPTSFLRVHRSHTVNLNHVTSAEEFDRRLVLHLSDGSEVTASRSGTQEFRRLFTLL